MAYIIIVNDDDTLYGSHRERIMQRSTNVNNLIFIVDPVYRNTLDMTDATVLMEYKLPVSKDYKSEYLVLDSERYNDYYLQYKLPLNTKLTSESGKVEIQLTFYYTELDANGNGIGRVRKTSPTTVEIIPIAAWSDIIPDSALSALDQRVLKQDAQIRALADLAEILESKKVDNLVYDKKEDTLHLSSNGTVIGDKVSVREMLDDGVPVVDLNSDSNNNSDKEHGNNCECGCNCGDNVVEFGYSPNTSKPTIKDDNIVEF